MLTSPRKSSVHHENDGTIDVEPENSVSQVAESVRMTSSSTFITRQVKFDKKRAELKARHAFPKSGGGSQTKTCSRNLKSRRTT